jgi:hypothetical protein
MLPAANPTANAMHTDTIGYNDAGGTAGRTAVYAKAVTTASVITPSRHVSFQIFFMPNLL